MSKLYWIFALTIALVACGDDGVEAIAGNDAGSDSSDDGGPSDDDDGGSPGYDPNNPLQLPRNEQPAFAVHFRAEGSAGFGLLDEDGDILRDQYVTSGSELPGLSEFLSSDISLPSNPDLDSVLTVVARVPANYILRIDYAQGKVLSQWKTQLGSSSGAAAYSSNPQDYLFLDEAHAWVSRYEPNLDPAAVAMNLGNDLVLANPTTGELVERVDLSEYNEDIEYTYTDYMTGDELSSAGTAYARPGRIVRVGDYAILGVERMTLDFNGAAAGGVLVFNPANKQTDFVALPKAKNCGEVTSVSGRADAVLVSCAGMPWGDAASAGLFLISVDGGKATIEHSYRAQGGSPRATFWPVSVGGTRVVVTETGWATYGQDVLYLLDIATGDLTELARFDEGGTIAFGGGYEPTQHLLLLGDRTNSRVLRYVVDGKKVDALDPLVFDKAFPVDGVYALRRF